MEVYDYKKRPAKKKEELPAYSDTIVKNGNSYRRLTKSEKKAQRQEEEKEKQDKENIEQIVNDIFDFLFAIPIVLLKVVAGVAFIYLNYRVLMLFMSSFEMGIPSEFNYNGINIVVFTMAIINAFIFFKLFFPRQSRRFWWSIGLR